MKQAFPFVVVLIGIAVALLSLMGSDGFSKRESMQRSIAHERGRNEELKGYVSDLKHKVYAIEHDDRELEKTARNKLGMAKADEYIFFFDKQPLESKITADGKN